MKRYIYYSSFLVLLSIFPLGCNDDFLERPPQDAYVVDEWFQTEEQIALAANALYGGVWFDYQRSFLNIGDVMGGNYYKGAADPFWTLSVNQSTAGVSEAYNSLWMAVTYSNSVIENIKERTPETVSQTAKDKYLGEALVWKAMAYFFLVRAWGDVPIIESNTKLIATGEATSIYRNKKEDVYEYIVRLLTKAAELLPSQNEPGRINKYSAYGLLAKVYLTRSGVTGTQSQEDLNKAKEYAAKVIYESGIGLEENYRDLFRLSTGNRNAENLISWHWQAGSDWGSQNALQADLAVVGLTGFTDGWGTWTGPSVDLQYLYGEDASYVGQTNRVYDDERRKATMMLDGDHYDLLKRDEGGLDVTWDGGAVFASPTGAWARKHIIGNAADNSAEGGGFYDFMKTSLSTHLLRLADVYLIYAEAILGTSNSTTDPEALYAYNKVRERAFNDKFVPAVSINFDNIMNERRRELAFEGDTWFDYVRLFYYDEEDAKARIAAQERGYFSGDATAPAISLNTVHYVPTEDDFYLPIPEGDLLKNPNFGKDPVPYDFSQMDLE